MQGQWILLRCWFFQTVEHLSADQVPFEFLQLVTMLWQFCIWPPNQSGVWPMNVAETEQDVRAGCWGLTLIPRPVSPLAVSHKGYDVIWCADCIVTLIMCPGWHKHPQIVRQVSGLRSQTAVAAWKAGDVLFSADGYCDPGVWEMMTRITLSWHSLSLRLSGRNRESYGQWFQLPVSRYVPAAGTV